MTFLANTKQDGNSFVVKASDQNGLPVFLKYEKDDGYDDEHQYDRELEIHGVEMDQDDVREHYKLGSSKTVKTSASKNRSMKLGILRREDRGLDNRKHRLDLKEEEKNTQNGNKFLDAEVNVEPKEDSDSLEEAIPEREVEILKIGAEVGRGSSSNPFVPSVEHRENLDATIIDSGYRKEVLNLLKRPYDKEEYKKLWIDIKMKTYSSTNRPGKSLLSPHKDVNREIKRANHDRAKKLNIMRGFFFWLEHLTREDALQPWEDTECLRMMPGSS